MDQVGVEMEILHLLINGLFEKEEPEKNMNLHSGGNNHIGIIAH